MQLRPQRLDAQGHFMAGLAIAARLLADILQDAALVIALQQQLLPLRAVILGGRQCFL